MHKSNGKVTLAVAGLVSGMTWVALGAATTGYQQSNLASDLAGLATFQDTRLVNPWGLLAGPSHELIVTDNHAGVVTFYGFKGRTTPFDITVPTPEGGQGAPTDLALSSTAGAFTIHKGAHHGSSTLLIVTEDGTILGWSASVDIKNAIIAVDNSAAGAIYKSMTLADTWHGRRLYAVNFGQAVVEIYDQNFHRVSSFTDANLAAASYSPFGIRALNGRLFVTFAFKAAPTDGDETSGAGLGFVDEFDTDGRLLRQFAAQGPLNAPWGLAVAPHSFGDFGGALLVGNFGDGAINAYNMRTGVFLGQLADPQGNVIHNEGLWGLAFRSDASSPSLYFAAGPGDENHGLLGALTPKRGNP